MSPAASDIRRQFMDFFIKRAGHTQVPSAPVVPFDDPTLLFTNAGMNQFKDVFLGQGTRPYTRAVDSQKCIRAGGKHNDLEDVGRDTYHHTFFEMLGNWSFGDYFKAEAIEWAWELLTDVWGVEADRLYASYFGGNDAAGLAADDEARELWLRHLPANRVLPFGLKDNFWEMGETGPCGPCSEIHFDRIGGRDASALVNLDDPTVLEIWNLVFIQFNREADGTLVPLPARHVDTGMGFERLVSVLQNKPGNYETDLWTPIFDSIRATCDGPEYTSELTNNTNVAYRVIADHVRCLTSALADGAVPGADGRSYVLRRILRRAVRHGRQTFGMNDPFLAQIVPAVVDSLGTAFPEIAANSSRVQEIIDKEEVAFRRTLDRGLELFAEAAGRAEAAGSKSIGADDAFKLHDTWGFPIDLTAVMAEERKLEVDRVGYDTLMEQAREKSRSGGEASDPILTMPPDAIAKLEEINVKTTDDSPKFDSTTTTGQVRAIWDGHGFPEHSDTNQRVAIILNRTPFYAEQGGQIGDTGTLHLARAEKTAHDEGGAIFRVEDTIRVGAFVLHVGELTHGRLHVNDGVECFVDSERRQDIQRNHTATHLLNLALRDVAGPGCDQRGSLVAPDRLRFDYASSAPLTSKQVLAIEEQVRLAIENNHPVFTDTVSLKPAQEVNTLRAVFGEQYPDPVRVVSIGAPVDSLLNDPGREDWMACSVEFCGGTHLAHTGEANAFVLLQEQGLAAGVRRIVAATGSGANAARQRAQTMADSISALEASKDEAELIEDGEALLRGWEEAAIGLGDRITLRDRVDALRQRVKSARKKERSASQGDFVATARELAEKEDTDAFVARLDGADRDGLLAAMDAVRKAHPERAVLLLAADEDAGSVVIVARVPDPLIKRGLAAGPWVKATAQACGGNGGGRPDSAQAGGKDPSRAGEAADAAREHAESVL